MNCKLLILRAIYERPTISQRDLAKKYFISLGKVNQTLKELTDDSLLEGAVHYNVTKKGEDILLSSKVDTAIILATDFGIKINPIDENVSKAFIEINNEKIIERQITQLNKVGIKDIHIIVGYQKEKYDYLIDKYNVNLIYDNEYKNKSTLSALYKAKEYIKGRNCYICPSNIYMKKNQFNTYEFEPYYCAKFIEGLTKKRYPDTTVQNEIISIILGGENAFCMSGFSFWTKEFSDKIMYLIQRYYDMPQTDSFSWEDVLMRNLDILPAIYVYKKEQDDIVEFDTLDDLRKFDFGYYGKGKFPIEIVTDKLGIPSDEIINIAICDIDITYNYWTFGINNERYQGKTFLLRIPNNEDIDIDYKNENSYYKNNPENIVLFDDKTGIKVTLYEDTSKTIDIYDNNNQKQIINFYKDFHNLDVKYKLNNISIASLFEKYEKLVKTKNIKMKFIDFDINYEKSKIILSRVKENTSEQKPINLHLYDNNIVQDNGKLIYKEFDNIGMGDLLDDIVNLSTKQKMNLQESEKLLDEYIKLDTNKSSKALHDKNIKQIFMYKLALMAMLNVLYVAYKEVETIYNTGDFQMKQYRIFKNIVQYLEEQKIL